MSEPRRRISANSRREKALEDLSKAELLSRITHLKADLKIYRLPSPERMMLLERLAQVQDRLINLLTGR